MSVKKTDRILNELRINCDHYAANLIEQLQQRVAELEQERDAPAAYQKELVRELQSCQNVLHMMAHHGEVTCDYSKDAKAVLDKQPKASLAEHDAEVMAKSIEDFADSFNGDKSEWVTYQAFKSSAYQYANKIRNGEDGER